MNYTENYHLPQWEETDRILRKDFNQMCADIEGGINTARADASDGQNRVEDRTFDRVCRLAYNHYCAAQMVKPFPRQIGVFHQDTSVSGEGLEGMSKFEGYYQVCNGDSFNENSLFQLFDQQGPMATTAIGGATQMTITFTAPGNGSIDKLVLQTTFNRSSTSVNMTCDLTFQDLTAGKTVKTAVLQWKLPEYQESNNFTIEEDLCFHSGHQYRITIKPRSISVVTSSTIIRSGMKVTCQVTGGVGTAAHVFQNPDENLGLLAVAAYRLGEGAEEPEFLLNGEDIPAWWIRDIADSAGKIIRESVFRRNGIVKDGDVMTLQFTCQPGGEATLYSWGAVLV